MKRILLLPLGLLILNACNKAHHNHTNNDVTPKADSLSQITDPVLSDLDLLAELRLQRTLIDTLRVHQELLVDVFAKTSDNSLPVVVENRKWPNHITTVFNVWKDSSGHTRCIGEYPYSESGDWDIGYTHYFDSLGQTYAFNRLTSFYNSLCAADIAIESITTYFNANHDMIDSTYQLKDRSDHILIPDSCQFPYDFPYKTFSSCKECLKEMELPSN